MPTAMVLSAGLGTRLSPLTSALPKALMPIGDRPIIAHLLTSLARAGVGRVVVNSHHLSSVLRTAVDGMEGRAQVVHEPELLGTAGGLCNASAELGDGVVLIWNADIWAPDLDIAALWPALAASAAPWLWVIEPRSCGGGSVGVDHTGAVVRLRGECFGQEAYGGEFIGVSVMAPELRQRLPKAGCLAGDVALPWLRAGGRIATTPCASGFIDVGTPSALLQANLRWLDLRGSNAWCAPDAHCSTGATLDRALVGAGARVHGVGVLSKVVIFPFAELTAPARASLAAPGALVQVESDERAALGQGAVVP
jgi:mannose-1-phosphate guanylyltransferase